MKNDLDKFYQKLGVSVLRFFYWLFNGEKPNW